MRRSTVLFVVVAVTAALGLILGGPTERARAQTAAGAGTDAYGLLVRATALSAVPLDVGPISEVAQDFPPGGAPASASVAQVTPIPADGSLVQNIGVMQANAQSTATPTATASAETANVALFAQAGKPQISADVLRAQANADCKSAPNSNGTLFVNLNVGGQPIGGNPAPNTVIPLGLLTVIINEQHPTADGRGFVVNAIHVVSTANGAPLFSGDVIISHAVASVVCPNGASTTGGNNAVLLAKTVSPTTASPGDTLTYQATITNKSTTPCVVNAFIDHAPKALDFVSTGTSLGTKATTADRPGGGPDVLVVPSAMVTVKSLASLTQTFVFKVRDDAKPGTYFNNTEVFCADQGDFVKGEDAPFVIPAAAAPPAPAAPVTSSSRLPATGGTTPVALVALLTLAGAALWTARRRLAA